MGTVNVADDLLKKVEILARAKHESASEIVRQAIVSKLDAYDGVPLSYICESIREVDRALASNRSIFAAIVQSCPECWQTDLARYLRAVLANLDCAKIVGVMAKVGAKSLDERQMPFSGEKD